MRCTNFVVNCTLTVSDLSKTTKCFNIHIRLSIGRLHTLHFSIHFNQPNFLYCIFDVTDVVKLSEKYLNVIYVMIGFGIFYDVVFAYVWIVRGD